MKTKITDDGWKVTRPMGRITASRTIDGWMVGEVATPDGFATYYWQSDMLSAAFIWHGREFRRHWEGEINMDGIHRRVAAWVREVVASN